MKKIINYGKHAASGTRKINEVTLTLSISPNKYYDPKTKEHYTRGEHFSVCGDIWNARHTDIIQGGQCVDYIVEHFAKDETSQNIRALWEVFHLANMDKIPERFRHALTSFISGAAESLPLERKRCAAYLLKVNKMVTDYGTFTDGIIIIKTPDDVTEVITLTQGDEMKHAISSRAHAAIKWLYDDAPTVEALANSAKVTTNAGEYYKGVTQKRLDGGGAIMKIYKEGISDFKPWSGAVDTWKALQEYDRVEALEEILEDAYPEGMSETDLNDLLWFEPETVCEWVGLYYNEDTGDISDDEPDDSEED